MSEAERARATANMVALASTASTSVQKRLHDNIISKIDQGFGDAFKAALKF